MNLPGYDSWKLATPPHYEDQGAEPICPECGAPSSLDDEGYPELCPYCAGAPAQCPLCDAPSSWEDGPDGPRAGECPACRAGTAAQTVAQAMEGIVAAPSPLSEGVAADEGTLFV